MDRSLRHTAKPGIPAGWVVSYNSNSSGSGDLQQPGQRQQGGQVFGDQNPKAA